jgi:DNA repair exonuclease SbcCD ATPase subunit
MVIFRKERLEAELADLRTAWKEQMERSLKAVAEDSAGRLSRDSEQIEKEVAARVAAMGKAFAETTAEAENKLSSLREALDWQDERSQQALVQLQYAEQRINDQAAKLAEGAAAVENKLSGLREYLNGQNERLQQSLRHLQAAEQRLSEQLAKLDVGLDSAGEMLRNIENGTAAAKESLRSSLENLARTSQILVGNSERQIEESGRAATAKWVAEIENKATDASYATFESLFKASEWYEKKVHAQMQTTLEKGLEQAASTLRETSDAAAGQLSTQMERQSAQIRAESEAQGQQVAAQFREALSQDAQKILSEANQTFFAQARVAQDAMRLETQAQETKLNGLIAQLGDRALEGLERRLEDASNLLLLSTVSKFSQRSEEHLQTLVRSARQRLSQTCNEVFTEVGETLRQRMVEVKLPRPAVNVPSDDAAL